MPGQTEKAKAIFLDVIEKFQPDQWQTYLAGACREDGELRAQVDELLKAHAEMGGFRPAANGQVDATQDFDSISKEPGTMIGPYKLLQEIGEGGFGVVYMAEQQEPVRRQVALKIIKPGMDTKEVIARFEAERQALALMDHPNIAKVLDAGATTDGRPYFVMEIVRGIPVTEFCDKNNVEVRQRLELFNTICNAVQYAHQKGVIHRDLKPSNVMVTLHDGKPVVKVIDFGISKAISQRLTEKTLFTRYGQMVGTPQYMSPEQAEMSGLDVDTRSDIYSLGVLLYELLTGTTPLQSETLRSAEYAEMVRMIQEEDPPKPSNRLSTLDEKLSIVCKQRSTDERHLRQFVQGDLDWIVMKALEKDRGRRYETANSFAADVERFLNDEAVLACPPSATYRFRKFARRNKALLATTGIIAVALLLGLAGTSWQWRQTEIARAGEAEAKENAVAALAREAEHRTVAEEQRNRAERTAEKLQTANEEISEFLLHQAFVYAMSGEKERTEKLIDQLTVLDTSAADIEIVRGLLLEALNTEHQQSLEHFRRATQFDEKSVAAWSLFSKAAFAMAAGGFGDAAIKARTLTPITSHDHLFLGDMSAFGFRFETAIEFYERSIELHDSGIGRLHLASTLAHQAALTRNESQMDRAVAEFRTARSLIGRNLITAHRQMRIFANAGHLAEQLGRSKQEIDELYDAAKEGATLLDSRIDDGRHTPLMHYACAQHFDYVEGDVAKAESYWQRALKGANVSEYAHFLLRHHGIDRVLEFLLEEGGWERVGRNLRVAPMLSLTSDGREAARRMIEEHFKLENPRDNPTRMAILALTLLGELDLAKRSYTRFLEVSPTPSLEIQYVVGQMGEEELLQSMEGRPHRFGALAFAHYLIAMRSLAPDVRDLEKARRHFNKSKDLRPFGSNWADAMLKQMERDPDWPADIWPSGLD